MQHEKDLIYRELITSRKWREMRRQKLQMNPFCERCKTFGVYTWATEVHHRQPIESVSGRRQKTILAFSMSNLQSLCHSCHVEVHKELGRYTKEGKDERRDGKKKSFSERFFE